MKDSGATFSLMIHGGAGTDPDKHKDVEEAVLRSMRDVLAQGRGLLAAGGSALEAVQLCVRLMEDDPLYNAGHGAIANREGRFELDAAIMDGADLRAGAVAAVENIRNPVMLARTVMEETGHVMFAGAQAQMLARAYGVAFADDEYFKAAHNAVAPMEAREERVQDEEPHGTVGAVARDVNGHIAAATSTGGWRAKMPGRVGDTPLIGAGTWADDESCAVSCTGRGEDFIRTGFARYLAALCESGQYEDGQYERGQALPDAAEAALAYLERRVAGVGGFIAVDRHGTVSSGQTAALLRHGWIERGGESVVTLRAPLCRAAAE